jgi:penicillin-binding protein 1B
MKLTGSSGALVLFANYMKHIGVSSLQLTAPEAIAEAKFERSTGNAVQGNCKGVVYYPAVSDGLSYSDCMEEIEDKRSWWQKLFGGD